MKTTSEFINDEENKPLQINKSEGMQQKLLKSKHGKKEE